MKVHCPNFYVHSDFLIIDVSLVNFMSTNSQCENILIPAVSLSCTLYMPQPLLSSSDLHPKISEQILQD